jgi:ABC-type transporter Mla MlaB component
VTLRITLAQDSGVPIIRLAGWLEGEAVAELERVASGRAEPLRLDLAELRSADSAGLTVLRALRARGARLVGASPYIHLLLGPEPARPPPSGGPGRKGRKA